MLLGDTPPLSHPPGQTSRELSSGPGQLQPRPPRASSLHAPSCWSPWPTEPSRHSTPWGLLTPLCLHWPPFSRPRLSINDWETALSSSPASCLTIFLSLSSQFPAQVQPHHPSCPFLHLGHRWRRQKAHPYKPGLSQIQTRPTREAQKLLIHHFTRVSWSS